jgi:hypothetical protein
MTQTQLQSPKDMLDTLAERWDEDILKELQHTFLAWMERLQCVIQNGREYFLK